MNNGKWLTRQEAEMIKRQYPAGTRLVLDEMDDPYCPVKPGTHGTVALVDDQGQIHMDWDDGRTLALILGIDRFHRE